VPWLQVISGQQLPKVDDTKERSIVDPLVKVEIFGIRADTTWKETSYVENNGERLGGAGERGGRSMTAVPLLSCPQLVCFTFQPHGAMWNSTKNPAPPLQASVTWENCLHILLL
jgi:hypothetical protein